ncbi:hypothetical protein LXA43DRAFT_1104330 [Ganoderma leucocontextum]|nr:hypothetical protein LXA43DRAFT_1104330 [Ganoderma leucocontextum]
MAYKWRSNSSLSAAVAVATLWVQLAQAGNTACVSNQLSWYTSVVGESPCMTYQRLRQICNNDYQVPNFASTVPGDRCDDQVSECCCNMVAFQLSMLCMVCQQDKQDSGGIGIDAPTPGTYTVYRGTCGAGVNHTLPSDLQSAICNENIRIDNFLYDSWDDGTWFYVWTKENVERLHAANNNNTFTHCPDQISPSPTPTSTSSSTVQQTQAATPPSEVSSIATPVTSAVQTSTSTSGAFPMSTSSSSAPVQTLDTSLGADGADGQSKSKSHASLIGAVVGGVLGLVAIMLAGFLWRRRKTSREGLQGTRGGYFEYKSAPTAPPVSAPAESLTPNRRLSTEGRPTSQVTYDDDPFMSGTSPRTPGMWSPAVTPAVTQPSASLTESALRHHDGGPLTTGLTRSNSGRLPPAYDASWDGEHGRRTHPSAGSVSAPPSDFPSSEVSGAQRISAAPLSTAYGPGSASFHEPCLIRVGPRTLPIPLADAGASDLKDPSLFN